MSNSYINPKHMRISSSYTSGCVPELLPCAVPPPNNKIFFLFCPKVHNF